jgi:predicted Zn-dependent peptidase
MLKIDKLTLPNKLRIRVMPMPSIETVTVAIAVRAGSRYETKSINGVAHFLEHMFFKGGKRYPTPRDVAAAIDAVGGYSNAFTGEEYVGYYVKVPKDQVEVGFDVLSDMLLNSQFEAEGFERERGVILEEYNMYEDQPQSKVWDVYRDLMAGDQPMGWPITGTRQTIKSITRKNLLDYRAKLYTPANMVVSVAGNVTPAKVRQLVKKYLPMPKGGKKNHPVPYKPLKTAKKMDVMRRKTEQAHLLLGTLTFGLNHPDIHVARVLADVLGGGMSSRLFTAVRERLGLAYYVRAGADHYTDTGHFVVQAGVDVKRIDLAIKTILEELKAITKELVPEKELKKAKESIIGSMMMSLESSNAIAFNVGFQDLLEDKIETPEVIAKKVRAVTAAQVQKLAKKIFQDDRLVLAVVGPYSSSDKIKKAFKL